MSARRDRQASPPHSVALAAGGTGGHLFPAEALARELLRRGCRVTLVTDRRGGGFGSDLAEVETCFISAAGIAGTAPLRRAGNLLRLAFGTIQARRALKDRGIDTVIGFGGYPSVPTVFAASRLGLRVILHEQNALLGRANRLLAGRAETIATSFKRLERLAPRDRHKVVVTGNPVRQTIAEIGRQSYREPAEDGDLRLLVTGGSQGARIFNTAVPDAIARLPEDLRKRLVVVQQVPGDALNEVAARYDGCSVRHRLARFFADLPEHLAAAHLVICRAGASTVAELAAAGRPAILVPYPYATDDHQTVNARALAEAGGAWLMPQDTLQAADLAERLRSLLGAPGILAQAAHAARAFAEDRAALRLADLVCARNGNGATGDNRQEAAA